VGYINKEIHNIEEDGSNSLIVELEASVLNLTEIEIIGLTDNQMPFSIEKIGLKKLNQQIYQILEELLQKNQI